MGKGFAMQLYEDARLVWGSANMLQIMLDSQMSISKVANNQLVVSFRRYE